MRKTRSYLLIIILLLILVPNYAAAGIRVDMVIKYVKLTGMNDWFDIQNNINFFFGLNSKSDEDNKIISKFKKVYNSDDAKKELLNYIVNNMDEMTFDEILQWQEGAVGSSINNEINTNKKVEMSKIERYIKNNPPSKERMKLVNDLVSVTKYVELGNIQFTKPINEMIRLQKRVDELTIPKEQNITYMYPDNIDKDQGLLSFLALVAVNTYYFYLKNIPDDEIIKSINYYKSDIGKKEIDMQIKAIDHVLGKWLSEKSEKLLSSYKVN